MQQSPTISSSTCPTRVSAVRITIPILLAFLPIGMGFGIYATQLGIPSIYVILMSFFVYAGSSEFLAASMIVGGESLQSILLAGFVVNFRHVCYGLGVRHTIPGQGLLRTYVISTLTDETFVILSSLKGHQPQLASRIAFLNHVYWFGSVILGSLLGSIMEVKLQGMNFILTALFIVMMVDQMKTLKSPLPFISAGLAFVAAVLVASNALMAAGICFLLLILGGNYYGLIRKERDLVRDFGN